MHSASDVIANGKIETPAYVYELVEVRYAYQLLTAALPESTSLHYSLKANAHPRILETLVSAGCHAEVSSQGELISAVAAGFRPGDILYTGPGKRDVDLEQALVAGVRVFSVDSPTGLAQLDKAAARYGVAVSALLRINHVEPARTAGLTMTGSPSQFGADFQWICNRPDSFADGEFVALCGLHLYMGSNICQGKDILSTFEYELAVASEVEESLGRSLTIWNLGGGFGAPYARSGTLPRFANLREQLEDLLTRYRPGWRDGSPRIMFESGRYLTATCGTLLSRVLDVKVSRGHRVVVLDTGVNHLGGVSGLGLEDRVEPHLVTRNREAKCDDVLIAGPLCHPLDNWTRQGALPDVEIGDLVAVPNVGAYGLVTGLTHFHGHPMPVEVVLDGSGEIEKTRIVSPRDG